MKSVIRIFLLLCFPVISISCESKDESILKLERYLSEDLKIQEVKAPHLYFFLPADSCSGIIAELTPYFNSNDEVGKFTIILIGRSKRRLDILSKNLKNREQIAYDINGIAFEESIVNPSTPRIFKLLPDEKLQIIEYPGFNVESIKRDINSFLKM